MMGMANAAQVNAGIHTRLWARALAAHDPATGKRFVFVSLDAGMGGIVLKNRVMKVRALSACQHALCGRVMSCWAGALLRLAEIVQIYVNSVS
jgi:hypothetical protein